MDKQKTIKVISAAVIFIIALIFIQFIKKSDTNIIQKSSKGNITKLPNFETLDVTGNPLRLKDFKGKNFYVQFVNPLDFDDLDLIKTVYEKWIRKDLKFIAITNDLKQFKSKINFRDNDVIILSDKEGKLINKFNSSYSRSNFYLFDKNGRIITSGFNDKGYEDGIKVHLNWLIYKKKFSISDFVPVTKNIHEIEWFKKINDYLLKQNKRFYIIAMFNSFCTSCFGGLILEKLRNIFSLNAKNAEIVIFLTRDYTELDIKNFKSQLNVDFSVHRADIKLDERFNYLSDEYHKSELNNIVFAIDKNGTILKVAYKNCNCYKDFFNFSMSLFVQRKEDH